MRGSRLLPFAAATHCAAGVDREVIFNGDYNADITHAPGVNSHWANQSLVFLSECSAALAPVACVSVRGLDVGGIAVMIQAHGHALGGHALPSHEGAQLVALQHAFSRLTSSGLHLPSFRALSIASSPPSDPSAGIIAVVSILSVVAAALLVVMLWVIFKWQPAKKAGAFKLPAPSPRSAGPPKSPVYGEPVPHTDYVTNPPAEKVSAPLPDEPTSSSLHASRKEPAMTSAASVGSLTGKRGSSLLPKASSLLPKASSKYTQFKEPEKKALQDDGDMEFSGSPGLEETFQGGKLAGQFNHTERSQDSEPPTGYSPSAPADFNQTQQLFMESLSAEDREQLEGLRRDVRQEFGNLGGILSRIDGTTDQADGDLGEASANFPANFPIDLNELRKILASVGKGDQAEKIFAMLDVQGRRQSVDLRLLLPRSSQIAAPQHAGSSGSQKIPQKGSVRSVRSDKARI